MTLIFHITHIMMIIVTRRLLLWLDDSIIVVINVKIKTLLLLLIRSRRTSNKGMDIYIFENYFQQIYQKEKKRNNKKGSSVPIHALVLIHLLIVQWNTGRLLLHEAIYSGQHGFNFKLVIFQLQFIKQKALTLFLFINLFVWLFGLERKPCCWCDDEPDEDWGEPRLSCSP